MNGEFTMIGAVIAMNCEAEILLSEMEVEETLTRYGKRVHIGRAFGRKFALCECGVGKVNAAVGTCAVLSLGAKHVINFGVAGGLHGGTALAEVYLIDRAVQYDFDLTQLQGGKMGTLDGETENFFPLFCPALPLPRRALASGDRFNDSAADHDLLLALGADIRDMEGAAIAQVCKYAGVPLLSVKAISDVYGTGEETTNQYERNKSMALDRLKGYLKPITEVFHD